MALFSKKLVDNSEKEMNFFEHLEELRGHIFRAVLSIFVFGVIVFLNKDFTFNTVIFGPLHESFPTYRFLCSLGEMACLKPPPITLETKEFGEQFFIHFNVSFWIGIICSFPVIVYEIWRFVKPGLYDTEIKVAKGLVAVCSSLFLVGVLFGYYVIAPFAITFLGSYSVGDKVVSAPTISSYVSYLTMLTIPVGLVFQLPVAAYFLGKIGLLSSQFLKTYRRHAIVVIVIIAAIVTPPDVTSQVLITIPILLLYEVSINVLKRVEKKALLASQSSENLPSNA